MTLIDACTRIQQWLCDITAGGKSIPEALGSRPASPPREDTP